MKRASDSDDSPTSADTKKPKLTTTTSTTGFHSIDENLLYEILEHADAKTLATAACVSKTWSTTASDERLWENICTQQWNNNQSNNSNNNQEQQLRSVVLALGGFRRLHSLYIWPLSKPTATTSSVASAPSTSAGGTTTTAAPAKWKLKPKAKRLGKDEVHLSLSLLSIRYYEKMNLGFGMMKR